MTNTIIDVHHHIIGKGPKQHAADLPEWNMEIDAAAMERMGIVGALLSLPVASTPERTRSVNDLLAELASFDSKRYGLLACLPSAHVDAALHEIEYAHSTLHADGFIMPTNANGIYVGDDRMAEILAELNRRAAVVLLHPTKPGMELPSLSVTDISVYEFSLETTRGMMDLIYRGKIAQFPNIRWIVSHAGGAIPFLAYRLSTVAEEVKASALSRDEVLAALRSLYFDTALSTSPAVFDMLCSTIGADRIVFGTDYPLRHEVPTAASVRELTGYHGFSKDVLSAISSGTAMKLFPRFHPAA